MSAQHGISLMGYTHSWSLESAIAPATWAKICADADKLIKAFPSPLHDTSIDDEMIFFNGGCESFALARAAGSEFCKTRHLPYDKAVCAILCVAAQHYAGLSVGSDALMGETPDGWPASAKWASKILGRDVPPPWSYRRITPIERLRSRLGDLWPRATISRVLTAAGALFRGGP